MSKAAELAALIGSGQAQGNRNLIINGAMQVAQRGTLTGLTNSYGGPDRYVFVRTGAAAVTMSQDTDVPSGYGFANSSKIDVTTADSSLAAGDYALWGQRFEGLNMQSIKKGTSNAKRLTASFWIKSSTTGTYILELYDSDNARQVSASYSVSIADTWEHKIITFPADTSGAIGNDNSNSLALVWWLAAGSTFSGGTLNTSWAASNSANRVVGQVNAIDDAANNIYFTGVQLEIGDVATAFEHEDIGTTLTKCQRYYQSIDYYHDYGSNSSAGNVFYYTNFSFPVTMRATPAMTASQWGQNTGNASTKYSATTVNGWIMQSAIPTGCLMRGNHGNIYNSMYGRGKFDAEL